MSLLKRLRQRFHRPWPMASLRTYLVAVILLAALPVAAILSYQIYAGVRADQMQIENELARSAAVLARSAERELTSSLDALAVLSRSELFQQGRITSLGRLLQGRPRRDWDSVFLMDRDGSLLLDTAPPQATDAPSDDLRELHGRVLQKGEPAVSGVSDGPAPGSRAVAVALPVMQGSTVRYVLGARMGEAVWQRLTSTANRPDGARAGLFDAQERMISYSLGTAAPAGAALPSDASQSMQGRIAGVHRSSDADGISVYAAWDTVRLANWRARVARPAGPIDAGHRKAIVAALSTSGASLLLGVLLALWLAARLARPLRALATEGPAGLTGAVPVREISLLRDALLLAAREAEAASGAKDEFLALLSHELRNPLGAISAAIDVLDVADPGSSTAAEARAIVTRQTRNLANMLSDLLDVGRVIAGKTVLARQPVNLAAVVRRVKETLVATGKAGEHAIDLQLDEVWLYADETRVGQVVSKLLMNAARHTPAGRSIQVHVRRIEGIGELQVRHAGTAIAPALLPHQCDLSVHGQRTFDPHAGGLDSGLALVRRLVELHGGTVGVESSDEVTRFTVRIPAVSAPAQAAADSPPAPRGRQVLVIEHEADALSALRKELELDGHTVITAVDGIQGLTRLLKLNPEVSIVDIGLPELSGLALAKQARAAGYAGRMVALAAADAARGAAQEAMVAGFDACLVKPVERNELRAHLSAE